MKLENLNLVELNAQEVKEVEGGIFPIIILGCAITAKKAAIIAACGIFAAGVYSGYQSAASSK
jgi:lactobin A/cerein 7B family class IIb bacteriocin